MQLLLDLSTSEWVKLISEPLYACLPLQLFVCISNLLDVEAMSEEPLAPESSFSPSDQAI